MKFIERFSRKPAPQVPPAEPGAAPLLVALEPRIMFDASVAVVAQEADQATAEPAKDSTSADNASPAAASADTRASSSDSSQRQEVVFVDGQVGNVNQMLTGLSPNAEIVVLDPSKDGLQQMADYLKGRENLDAIHLLSHGADGTVQAGNVWLAQSNLAQHSAALESIGAALKADGDLMLYGCKVGDSSQGQAFIDALAQITGADVAASADDTGAAALGGNWSLERSSGQIQTSALAVAGYEGVLASSWTTGNTPLGTTIVNAGRTIVGDFDGDGDTDILYQTGGTGTPFAYARSDGNGSFTQLTLGQSPFAGLALPDASGTNYFVGDFDGDGDVDVLVGVNGSSGQYFRNDGATFSSQSSANFPSPGIGSRMVVGDFDRDGDADILYQTAGNTSPWGYYRSNGDGTFTNVSFGSSPFAGLALPDHAGNNYYVADFDGDGDLDILAAVSTATGTYLRNDGASFSTQSTTTFPAPTFNGRMLVGDFDGDGDADILYQTANTSSPFQYARSNGDGTFNIVALGSSPFTGMSLADHTGSNYRVGDFDGDGDVDIFFATNGSSGNLLLQTDRPPTLLSSTPSDNATGVSPGANIVLTFSESVIKGTGNIYIVRTSDNQIVETIPVSSGRVAGSGATWTIDPSMTLVGGVSYAVRIDSRTFVDTAGIVFQGISDNTTLNFTAANLAAPVIANLNGDAANYVEKSSGILLDGNNNATVTDADSANFNGGNVRVAVTGNAVTSEDVLSVYSIGAGPGQISVSGSNVLYGGLTIGTVAGGTGGTALVITLNANADASAVTALVRNLQYSNSNTTTPNTSARTLSITVTDETGTTSTVSTVTANILAVNDAPVVSATGTNPTFTEDGSAVAMFSGASINTVESTQNIILITISVSNLANGPSEKLVIDGSDVTLTNGTNLLTLNNGATVSVSVSAGTATVSLGHAGLSTATAQTIVNNIAYRNDSNAPTGTSRTVTLSNVRDSGGLANGGQNTVAVNVASIVTLVAVNDAPTLSGGPYVITSTNENTTSGAVSVSTVLAGATYADADAGAASGIAVIATVGRGTWEYSTDGTNWTAFGTVSTSSALLLTSSSQVRYIPDNANAENVSFTYRGWDRTSGAASTYGSPSTGDTTVNGSSTAYSTGSAQATLIVTAVNDAPVMTPVNPTLTGLTDTSTNNSGDAVSSLLGGLTDVDTGAIKGMAITGLTSTYGKWQYSINAGTNWTDIVSASDASALVLRSGDRVRFVPDGLHGETATITYRAWDQTNGTLGQQGTRWNVTSLLGGSNTFSSGTDTASVVVTAANDAPVLTGSGGSVGWTEGNNVVSTPVAIDNLLVISDPDGPSIASATVSLGGTYVLGEDTLAFTNIPATMGDIIGSWDAVNGILTLTSAGGATQAQFQAALRSITYTNDSDTPTTTTRTVSFKVNDGSLDSLLVTRDVTITAVNDAPVISAPTNVSVTEDTLSPVTGIILSDVDSSSGTLTLTVGAGTLSGVSASGVTVNGTGSALTLSGTLTAINNFIAAGSLKYTPALNSNTSVTLGLSLDTTSVGTDTRNLTLDITAVNDAPAISSPVSINVTEDVATSMAGITFSDVDAGSGSVRVIFSVANGNGTFSATASSGVTISNDGTNAITLEGTVADINTLVSNGHLTYLGALNATGLKTMSISINDNGNTGSGGALQDAVSVSLVIAAVNDAPVNNLPAAQSVPQDGSLVFSSTHGNLITISDVDAGGNLMKLSLTAVNGKMTLGSLVGLFFSTGDGINDAAMAFTGTLAAINAALNGLTFIPDAGYNGPGSITFESDDQGYSGSGGAKTDVDTLAITISPINPKITGVVAAPGSNGLHKAGDQIDIVVNFDNNVVVDLTGGRPTLLLETGAIDRDAVYVSGSGTTQLTFRYTVQAGDVSGDLDYASTTGLSLNGAVLQSTQGYAAILTLPTLGGASSLAGQQAIVIDGVAPSIGNIVLPGDASYRLGQNLDFTVNFSEVVSVNTGGGIPRIEVTLDTGGTAYAEYVSGSGTSALVFRLVVTSGQQDSNGISVGNSIQLNGGSLRDLAGNDSATALVPGSSSGILVDGIVPTVATVSVPANGGYKAGDVLSFTVNASEAVFASGSPRLALDVGGITRYATLVPGSSSGSTLVFQYTVQAGETDADGISVGSSLDLNGGSVKDAAGNDLNLTLNSVGSTTAVLVDTTAPSVTGIVSVDPLLSNRSVLSYTVTFDEDVTGLDAADFNLMTTGNASGTITGITRVDGRTYTVQLGNVIGDGTLGLNLRNDATVYDNAGNRVTGGLSGAVYTVDQSRPYAISVTAPSNGHVYVAGENIDISIKLSEVVYVTDIPRLGVVIHDGAQFPMLIFARYVSGSGSDTLVFRLPVTAPMLDRNGILLGSQMELSDTTVRDAAGNDASAILASVGIQTDTRIDAVTPEISSVTVPAAGGYKSGDVLTFTVNVSEAVQVDTTHGSPRLELTIGGVTRYASYVSGNGTDTLTLQYTVQSGDNGNGVSLAGNLDLNGSTVRDPAGNAIKLPLNNLPGTDGINVDTTTPYATNITRVDATPTNSGSVSYTVTFSENVGNVDISDFNLIFGGSVAGSIESVTAVDGKTFTVKVSSLIGTGTVRLDLKPGTDIADAAGNLVPGGRVGVNYSIDRDVPKVTGVDVPANGTYVAGQNLDFTVHLSEAVQLNTSNGSPRLQVLLDNGQTAWAEYVSGAGSNALLFRLTVSTGQLDRNGISVGTAIQLNGATLRDAVGNNAQLGLDGLPPTDGVLIDAVAPSVASVGVPVPGAYNAGDVLRFTVNTSEPVIIDTSSGTPRVAVNIGGVTRYAEYVSGSGTSALVFAYTIQAGNNAAGGIAVGGSIDLNGGTARDAAGNALNLALNNPGSGSGIVIDTTAPQVSDIVRVDTTPTSAGSVRYTVTFDESVSGVDSADFSLAFTGSANGRIASVQQVNGRTYVILVDNLSGAGNVRLDLNASGTGISDVAGNPITGGLAGSSYSIDRVAPSVSSVGVPPAGTYVAGAQLDFTVNTSEAVLVDTGDGAPRLAITLDNGRVVYADYLSGSGGTALVFRLNVTSGMAGNGNFNVASSIDLNGATIRDARGNDAQTGLNNVGSTSGILVDARAPRPSSIVVDGPVLPTDRSLSFTLTFDEAVSGVDANDFSVLGTSSASGVVQSVQQVDARTYRIVVGDLRGQGSLALRLNALGSGIQDGAGNQMAVNLVGQAQSIQTQDVGDLDYRINPPQIVAEPLPAVIQPQVPNLVVNDSVSPLVPGSLFEVRTVGGDIQPLGTIFLGNANSAPSFIAQVFGSSDSGAGLGGPGGFLGFGGGSGGVFGGSTLSTIFSHDVPGVSEMSVFNGSQWRPADINHGLRGVFGSPTFGQQLQQLNEADQRHVRELAKALAQPAQIGQQA
ncbi:DUF4347 domain-containing protein [Pseudomonas japonica]|uniref:Repeat domain-containing protein n=1 Tax=Pseudomonas japonica TaxID=256466 RepID=A0A239EQN3_9PSED|nr:DUF4347 domain-containing protein [Pseudomonas japonica]SNS46986.1 Repeat domain-containing protein [Pseudomonas japonica]